MFSSLVLQLLKNDFTNNNFQTKKILALIDLNCSRRHRTIIYHVSYKIQIYCLLNIDLILIVVYRLLDVYTVIVAFLKELTNLQML